MASWIALKVFVKSLKFFSAEIASIPLQKTLKALQRSFAFDFRQSGLNPFFDKTGVVHKPLAIYIRVRLPRVSGASSGMTHDEEGCEHESEELARYFSERG
jgi:hypothetical protein